jgi:hypothetical protein
MPIAEGPALVADYLLLFVPFTGNHYQIVCRGLGQSVFDCGLAVMHDTGFVRLLHAGQYFLDNFLGYFVARVIVSDNDPISQFLDCAPHARAFALVAVTTTAKNTPQLSTDMLTRSPKTGAQRLFGMCKINHSGCAPGAADKFFHAPGNGPQIFHCKFKLVVIKTQRNQRGDAGEGIFDIEAPQQSGHSSDFAEWRDGADILSLRGFFAGQQLDLNFTITITITITITLA